MQANTREDTGKTGGFRLIRRKIGGYRLNTREDTGKTGGIRLIRRKIGAYRRIRRKIGGYRVIPAVLVQCVK